MKVPTFREAERVLGIDRNPLEHFVMNWEPSMLIDDPDWAICKCYESR